MASFIFNATDDMEKFPNNKPSNFTVDIPQPIILSQPMICIVNSLVCTNEWIRYASAYIRWKTIGENQWQRTVRPLRQKNTWSLLELIEKISSQLEQVLAPLTIETVPITGATRLIIQKGSIVEISSQMAPFLGWLRNTKLQADEDAAIASHYISPYKASVPASEIIYLAWKAARPRSIGRESLPIIAIFRANNFSDTPTEIRFDNPSKFSIQEAGSIKTLVDPQLITTLNFQLLDSEFRELEFDVAANVHLVILLEFL